MTRKVLPYFTSVVFLALYLVIRLQKFQHFSPPPPKRRGKVKICNVIVSLQLITCWDSCTLFESKASQYGYYCWSPVYVITDHVPCPQAVSTSRTISGQTSWSSVNVNVHRITVCANKALWADGFFSIRRLVTAIGWTNVNHVNCIWEVMYTE